MDLKSVKKNIIEIDANVLKNIFLKNIFLILFFGLLFLTIGYFYQNSDEERKMEIRYNIYEIDYSTALKFNYIYELLKKITDLEMEYNYIYALDSRYALESFKLLNFSHSLPTASSNTGLETGLFLFTGSKLLSLVQNKLENKEFNRVVYNEYNNFVRKEFENDEIKLNKFILKQEPTIDTNFHEAGKLKVYIHLISVKDEYVVRKYLNIMTNKIREELLTEVKDTIEQVYTKYDLDRNVLMEKLLLRSTMFNNYGFDLDEFNKLNSSNKYRKYIELSGVYDFQIDFFRGSSNLESIESDYEIIHNKTKSQNSLIYFPILGLIIGIFLSIIFYGISRKSPESKN